MIEITKPPFQLVRHGWGEFPIRLHVVFWDEERNHPVDIIHALEVCYS